MFNHYKQTSSFYNTLQAANMYNQDIYFWHDGNFGYYVSILQFSSVKNDDNFFHHVWKTHKLVTCQCKGTTWHHSESFN